MPKENHLIPDASANDLLTFFSKTPVNDQAYAANLGMIRKVIEEEFKFPLSEQDRASLEYVYKNFRNEGLDIAFRIAGGGAAAAASPP